MQIKYEIIVLGANIIGAHYSLFKIIFVATQDMDIKICSARVVSIF